MWCVVYVFDIMQCGVLVLCSCVCYVLECVTVLCELVIDHHVCYSLRVRWLCRVVLGGVCVVYNVVCVSMVCVCCV